MSAFRALLTLRHAQDQISEPLTLGSGPGCFDIKPLCKRPLLEPRKSFPGTSVSLQELTFLKTQRCHSQEIAERMRKFMCTKALTPVVCIFSLFSPRGRGSGNFTSQAVPGIWVNSRASLAPAQAAPMETESLTRTVRGRVGDGIPVASVICQAQT